MNVKNILQSVRKYIPQILSVAACGGVAATAFLSSKAAIKSCRAIDEKNIENLTDDGYETDLDISKTEIVKLCWKYYIPTAVSTLLTIGCIIGSDRVSAKQLATLAATCSYLASYRDKLEQEIEERYGHETLEDIRDKVQDEMVRQVSIYPEETGYGDLLCYEAYSGRYFYSSQEAVQMAEHELNERHMDGSYLCLNDFYDLLGISPSLFGFQFGWPPADSGYGSEIISFEDSLEEQFQRVDEPVYVIEVQQWPMECWMEV